ncbi:peptidase S8 and S53, subtilisin, kexin, sedolisin [Arthrobacter sp. Hiyo8]|nr:peptidase S8 and S53, subtilisin, kexin, sedolisin [Arthrobacter sp. Hiyo8]
MSMQDTPEDRRPGRRKAFRYQDRTGLPPGPPGHSRPCRSFPSDRSDSHPEAPGRNARGAVRCAFAGRTCLPIRRIGRRPGSCCRHFHQPWSRRRGVGRGQPQDSAGRNRGADEQHFRDIPGRADQPKPDGTAITHRHRTGGLHVPAALDGVIVAVLGLDDRPQARAQFRAIPSLRPLRATPRRSWEGSTISLRERTGRAKPLPSSSWVAATGSKTLTRTSWALVSPRQASPQ